MLPQAGHLRSAKGVFGEEGVEGWWLDLLTPEVVLALVGVFVVVLLAAVLAAWLVYRRVRRNGTVRRWVDKGRVTARAHALPPGPAREVAELRVRLREARDRARTALDAAGQHGASATALAHLPALAARLEDQAAYLDGRLAALERHPPHRVGDALPQLREQVGMVEEAEATLHRGLDLSVLPGQAGDMQQLQQELDGEVQALQTYQETYRDVGGGRS